MANPPWNIKAQLPHGAQREIAASLGVSESLVSQVVNGARLPRSARGRRTCRKIQVAIARRLRMRVDELFPPNWCGEMAGAA